MNSCLANAAATIVFAGATLLSAAVILLAILTCAPPLWAATNNAASNNSATLVLPPPPGMIAEPSPAAGAAAPSSGESSSAAPNQALAEMAKDAIIKSLPPEYEKQENWGHQTDIVDGFHWTQRADGTWHLAKQTKPVNDGTWRMYRVRLENPEQNLKFHFSTPQPAAQGGTAFSAFITARLWTEGRQEQWVLGVKGLNFHVEGYATVQARLDIVVTTAPVPGGGIGAIQVLPQVTNVDLKLVDLTLTKVDLLHGDAARDLGHALKGVVNDEIRKREPQIAKKINDQIQKQKKKLVFAPAQIAEIGWDKIQAILGGASGSSPAAGGSGDATSTAGSAGAAK